MPERYNVARHCAQCTHKRIVQRKIHEVYVSKYIATGYSEHIRYDGPAEFRQNQGRKVHGPLSNDGYATRILNSRIFMDPAAS